jgi:cupin fold WbuC family metalloprotein
MIGLDRVNDGVFVAQDGIVHFGDEEIAFVKKQAQSSTWKRARICAHKTGDESLHEMLIAILAGSYIHPHKHFGKSESFHIVDGEVDVVIFDEYGHITDVIQLGVPGSGRQFFCRLYAGVFHTLIVRTNFLVVHEVTNGPLIRANTALASFAPYEEEFEKVGKYMHTVAKNIANHLRSIGNEE